MSGAAQVTYKKFARRGRAGVLFGLTWTGLAMVSLGTLLTLGVIFTFLPPVALAPAALIAAGGIPVGGRAVVGWVPVFGGYFVRTAIGQTRFAYRLTQPRPSSNLGLPGDAARLRIVPDPTSQAALIHDPHLRRLTAILRVEHEGAILVDESRRVELDAGWGRVLASWAQFDSTVCRVQTLERTLPGGAKLIEQFRAMANPEVSPALRQVYEDTVEGLTGVLRHESLIALTLDLDQASQQVREMGGGMTGASALMRELMHSVSSNLHPAGLSAKAWLDEAAVALLIRSVYDPEQLPRLEASAVGRRVVHAGPIGVRESFGHVQTDSAFHRVFVVTEWPRRPVGPMGLGGLFLTSGIQRSISQVYRPVRSRSGRKQAERTLIEAGRMRERRFKRRGFDDPQDRQEEADANRRLEQITLGAREYDFIGVIVVTAPTYKELLAHSRIMLEAASRADVELRALFGQQAQHLVTGALPFGRGLE